MVTDGATIAHKNIVVDSVVGPRVHPAGFTTTCNKCTGRNHVNARYDGERTEHPHKYGATIEADMSLEVAVFTMPGCHVRAGAQVPGPCVLYGDGRVRRATE